MTIQECYQALGGNYDDVVKRLLNFSLVKRFITKFLQDDSFEKLSASIRDGRREEAFRAAHTLKGVCQNLGFGKLLASTEKLTELLRPETDVVPEGAAALLEEVTRDYAETTTAIRTYLETPEQPE
ncbi:Hpt domain-containing protein [Oscillibacter sp.]|uniref:Hpt domain-containing protein n=1 Tax=Oscillibacter sp. TaxID=1945593 RepID=UPI001B5B0DBD|nr:Hpt domain-containing protein [Oscillibacter sp.]MBP3508818.1 Hpt domain-containing protein [Oscillibacter sp.]